MRLAAALTLPVAMIAMAIIGINAETNLPPCPTEDSNNCYWNADTMGNGHGHSFVTINGVTTYTN